MSEPKDSNDSEQERRELSDEEHAEIDMETDNKEAENPQSPAEGNLESNGSELIETPIVHKPSENMVNDDGLPLESKGGAEIPVSTNLVTNDFDQNDLKENIAEEKHEMGKEHLENEEKVVDAEETEDHAEDNQTDETHMETERDEALMKVDGAGGDSLKQIAEPVLSFRFDPFVDGDDDGTEEDQAAFMRELENFHKEMNLEFKAPKFYGEGLNCLKLWRAVTRLGGYDQVTSCKLWRQVGESFKPPKTCTTVSWSFRSFYEKALYKYEMHKIRTGELRVPISSSPEHMTLDHQVGGNQTSGSGRARRDAAARAMQGWHSRLLGNGEVGDPIIKDKTSASLLKRDQLNKNIGGLKRKKSLGMEYATKVCHKKGYKPQVEAMVVDIGHPADWVKINVKRTKDCFEVYALVPGLLREEVHVQSDPAGRLILSGEPEQPDNPWGVTPFKKVLTLPSRIDPHQTSAVVTLHGQLFVRAPFERSDL